MSTDKENCILLLPETQRICVSNSNSGYKWNEEVTKQTCMVETNYDAYYTYAMEVKNKVY